MMVNELDALKTHLDTFDEYVVEMSDKSPKNAAVRKAIAISCDDSVGDSIFLDDSGRSNLDEELLKEAKKNLGKNKKGTTFVKSKASYPAEGTLEALLSRNKEEIAARTTTPRKTFEDAEEPKSLIYRMLMGRKKKETEEIVSKSRLNQAIKDNAFVVTARWIEKTKPTGTKKPVDPFAEDEKSASSASPSSAVNHLSLIEDEEAAFPNESLSSIDPNIVSGSASSRHFDPFFNEESATSFFEESNGSDYSFFEDNNGSSFSSSFGCDNPVLFDYDATERTNSTRSLSVSEDGEPSEKDNQSLEVSPCKSSSSRRLLVDSPGADGNEDNRRTGERKMQKRTRVKPSTGKRNSKDKMKCIRQLPSPRSGQHSKGRSRRSRTENQIQGSRHRREKRPSAPMCRSDHTAERSKSRGRSGKGADSLSEGRRPRSIRSGPRQRRSSKSNFPDQNRIDEPQDVGRPQDRARTPIKPQNKDMRRSRSVDVLSPVSSDAPTDKSTRRRKLATNRCRSRSPGHTRPVRSRSLRRIKGDEQGFQEPISDDPFEVLNSPVQRISSWLKKQQSSKDIEEHNIQDTATPEVEAKSSSSHMSRGEKSSSRSVSKVSSPITNRSEASSRRKDSLVRSQSMGNLSNATTPSKPLRRALKGTSRKSRRALLETGGSIENTSNNIDS